MGKSSSSSCLKIIACGSHDVDNDDDIDTPEAKASSDKRGWSFRKRSGRHRVLGNNVSSETAAVDNKEIPAGINTEFQVPVNSNSPEEKSHLSKPAEKTAKVVFASELVSESKPSTIFASENAGSDTKAEAQTMQAETVIENAVDVPTDEAKMASAALVSGNDSNVGVTEPQIGTDVAVLEVNTDTPSAEPKTTESVVALGIGDDDGAIMDEHGVIIIQTAIRKFLAQRAFVQLKSAIKLQAAIRGHLVRRNAVETLHCIRAIVKVQSLVRARSSKSLDRSHKPSDAKFSAVKLLQNGFARQLLESTPKPKSVNIRCDPLRPNSTWGWLARWMSVSTSEAGQKIVPVEVQDDNQDQETAVSANADMEQIDLPDSEASKVNMTDLVKSQETEENCIIDDVSAVDSMSCYPSSAEVKIEKTHPQKTDTIKDNVASAEVKIVKTHPQKTDTIKDNVASPEMDASAYESSNIQAEPISLVDKPSLESMKRPASEELDGEGKKFAYGSRKASNPAFIAAQSKFEELSAAPKFSRSVSSSSQDTGSVSHVDRVSSPEETCKKTNEPAIVETAPVDLRSHVDRILSAEETVKKTNEPVVIEAAPVDLQVHVAASECGTELSISSTLDSPVRSDFGNTEAEQKKFVEETSCDPDTRQGPGGEANGMPRHFETDLPSVPIQQEEAYRDDGKSADPVVAEVGPQEEQKLEKNASDLQTNIECVSSVMTTDSSQMEQKHELNDLDTQLENVYGIEHQGHKLSPEASPKSHRTVPESQGTPSSQVSVKSRKNKSDKSGSNTKRSSLSGGKRIPSNPGLNSGARSSTENLPKDHKSAKRRNSFGSSKSDNVEQEPGDSSARTTLPSYMQATESARAKAHSPRSSPDVHDKEVFSKKRHSLPGAGGRQDSPRIQRSSSQAAQSAKANGSNERKWQR